MDCCADDELMTVHVRDIERVEVFDPDPDLSYLDPYANPDYAAENAERRAAYRAGDWHCIGIKAKASFLIAAGDAVMVRTVESPGLWGVESDSDAAYLADIFRDETAVLRNLLKALGVTVIDG